MDEMLTVALDPPKGFSSGVPALLVARMIVALASASVFVGMWASNLTHFLLPVTVFLTLTQILNKPAGPVLPQVTVHWFAATGVAASTIARIEAPNTA